MNKFISLTLFISVFFISCTSPSHRSEPVINDPMIEFARQKIDACLSASSSKLFNVQFYLDTVLLEAQEYRIRKAGRNLLIFGGDSRGMMYGGLEVAEQLELYSTVRNCSGSPFIAQRGLKFNIPLDARTPSYDDTGDAAQKNIAEMWSWEFWKNYLDRMAENRYNVLTLWNPHPFPSMVKLDDYPDVALNDVCRTTLIPEGLENEWGDPQLVTTNVMENLEVLKIISIDEKIAFWQKLMEHAHKRGVDIYWITWNICPNSVAPPVKPFYKTYRINLADFPEGKHGVTYELGDPVTIDYYRKSVEAFLKTYPYVKGIGVTAGEHMPLDWNGYNREKWLWETYGEGIMDVKRLDPEREVTFIHRVWHSDMDQIMTYWGAYPDPFEVSFKYAKARLYSTPTPDHAKEHLQQMRDYNLKSWWNLRNDDIFVYRWGDPEYVRTFLEYFDDEMTAGYHMGSDGYVWGREFSSKDKELIGQLEVDKHWYNFMLWGRLGYNNGLEKEFFIRKLEVHFDIEDAGLLYETWQKASQIIPLVNVFHWRDWDHMWSVESCSARPKLGGYRDVFDFVDNPTLKDSGILNPKQYADLRGKEVEEGVLTPLEIVDSLKTMAEQVLDMDEALRQLSNDRSYQVLLDDMLAQADLGLYYASKITAALHMANYAAKGESLDEKQSAIQALEESALYWSAYAEVSIKNYRPQMLARCDSIDWNRTYGFIEEEIQNLKNSLSLRKN